LQSHPHGVAKLLARLPNGGGWFIDIGMKQAAREMTWNVVLSAALADVVRRAALRE